MATYPNCNNMVSANMQTDSPQREPYVASQIKRMEMLIERIEQDAESIGIKFSPVTRPSGPTCVANPLAPDECGIVPIAGHLLSMGNRLNLISDKLRDIIQRCEL